MLIEKDSFLKKYHISKDEFEASGIRWDEMKKIYNDYKHRRKQLSPIANYIAESLRSINKVHSIKLRLKDPEHLIAKIIRKQKSHVTLENYTQEITDIIGIRAMHLFKEDWKYIHKNILTQWELLEDPIAYIRDGDEDLEFKEHNLDCVDHSEGYRSVHYLIKSQPYKNTIIAEIQVRTLFEEGWSEIDHTIRYPYHKNNPLLKPFLDNFNILSGNADRMGTYIRFLKKELDKKDRKYNSDIQKLRNQIEKLKIEKQDKDNINATINHLSEERENSLSEELELEEFLFTPDKEPSTQAKKENISVPKEFPDPFITDEQPSQESHNKMKKEKYRDTSPKTDSKKEEIKEVQSHPSQTSEPLDPLAKLTRSFTSELPEEKKEMKEIPQSDDFLTRDTQNKDTKPETHFAPPENSNVVKPNNPHNHNQRNPHHTSKKEFRVDKNQQR